MRELFVSVDVETTGPSPVTSDLLTIGAAVVAGLVGHYEVDEENTFYAKIDHGRDLRWDPGTRVWWNLQNQEVVHAAIHDANGQPPIVVASKFEQWIEDMKRFHMADVVIFAAHPAGFDWQFVNGLFHSTLRRNPFGYRSLCLRSLSYGISLGEWGEEREVDGTDFYVPSTVKHHALHDAVAQAKMLHRMLEARGRLLRLLKHASAAEGLTLMSPGDSYSSNAVSEP